MDFTNSKNVETKGCDKDVLRITNLKVWTPEEKSWWRRKVTKPKTVILNNVTGCIKEGEFVAVLGPSGAGKTTFLVSLAGKCSLPSEGVVTVKGTNVRELQDVAEVVPQSEAFMPSLTVMEHLVFMTEMKLGSCKTSTNRVILTELMHELKLKPLEHTLTNALSGGERRLLSLATSLLSNPEILICDEPTTGLDSYNASLVIGVLKKIASFNKVVICSVHQPSSDLFKEFSSIMLMAEGRLLFQGTQDDCRDLFESINLHCPNNYNPAEFYIRAVSSWDTNENHAQTLTEIYEQSPKCHGTRTRNKGKRAEEHRICQRNWLIQVYLLLWRSSLTLPREVLNNLFQLFVCLGMSSIVIGTCYVGISGTTQRGIQDLRGYLWLICSEICFSLSYNALYVFEGELTLFRREIPRCIIWPVMFVVVATITVELPNYVITSLEFILALMWASVAATAYGLGMAALFTSTGVMGDVMPCADLPLFLMSGAFLRISSLPIWLHPVKYISHFYYVMDALSNIYWRQIDHIDCPYNTTMCVNDGISVLVENGYAKDFILQDTLGLLCVTIIWSALGYYGLKREEKKGYAY
ncbi:protein white-like isoform X2 [Pectinophora gossypiella]|uniref:protein white-like isoform X2 n=1 Tax=Pectinophora gossypiella TaxID=13191 RepID=UPI00214EB7AE|nr:protein white-like isoform X2 [Pectinophora gossypiella]